MTLDINVQGGDPRRPGFTIQRGPTGLTVGSGPYSIEPVGFGITNDQNGLAINAYPAGFEVYTLHYFREPGEHSLAFFDPTAATTCELLVVAGGGTGGGGAVGGGGAGGEVRHETDVELGGEVPIVVGAGGIGGLDVQEAGSPSSLGGGFIVCIGGGYGAGWVTYSEPEHEWPASGGAAGGGGTYSQNWPQQKFGAQGSVSFAGGNGAKGTTYGYLGNAGGGGGGMGRAGQDASSDYGGPGGTGAYCDIIVHGRHEPDTRYSCGDWYGGGGGGSVQPHSYIYNYMEFGAGGRGGGGGAVWYMEPSSARASPPLGEPWRGAACPNSGGGGGGSGTWNEPGGGGHVGAALSMDGGIGVVIVRYDGEPRAEGGDVEVRRASTGEVV